MSTSETTAGVYFSPTGKKTFIPLENNPSVFTDLIHRLGVSPQLSLHDVYSIDDPDLLAMVPRPVHALIFISPGDVYHRVRAKDPGSKELFHDDCGEGEKVMWFQQTIGNACGLIALLHSVANGSARSYVIEHSPLDKLLKSATPLKPKERAQLLYDSEELEKAHMAVAVQGDTVAPEAAEKIGYHFISFVKGKDGHLYELEGSWGGPIDRGTLAASEDVMSEKALNAGVRKYIDAADGNMEFSIVALAGGGHE
ncbi:hypothetical protein KC331_g11610 [Hortaea werneckii]|uniref:Ubiquitin carboxyl-terminal hydrolase n=1 Tax=Hortaea werneckii TaxID=91943 RepID=A0A3M7D2D5_HORWE|nr:hypothetical protein KC331_g11610 [Hortaea werneckii]KAI7701706.1 hypothetical protein KC353_g15186 [Hortaea werneckii]RMY58420.1 hypothetical protein D0865_02615 [Hortaea werneckii]